MTDQLRKMPDHDDGTITVGSLTPGGNRIGPKAWNLIVALSQYDDWFGAVLDVIDEAATPSPDTLDDDAEHARIAVSLWDRLPHDEASRRIVRDVLGVDPVDDMEAALAELDTIDSEVDDTPRALATAAAADPDEGIVHRSHVACVCCWCGEHHEEGE